MNPNVLKEAAVVAYSTYSRRILMEGRMRSTKSSGWPMIWPKGVKGQALAATANRSCLQKTEATVRL